MQTTKETETFVPQTCSPEELVSLLESHGQSGLTQRQARYRLRLHGKNLFRKEFALRPAEGIKSQLRGMVSLLFIATMLVLRVPALYFLANTYGPEYMYWGYAVGWTAGCALSVWYYCAGKWKKKGSLAH